MLVKNDLVLFLCPRLEVFDDDGKAGPGAEDESIGVGHFSLHALEQAHNNKTPLNISDKRWGKTAGQIIVRTFRLNNSSQDNSTGSQYPQQRHAGYPPQVHNPPQAGYPPQVHNPPQAGYPPQGGCPPQTGYPANVSNLPYPPQPAPGGVFGGGFSKPPAPLNGQMAQSLGMNHTYPSTNNAGGFTFNRQ